MHGFLQGLCNLDHMLKQLYRHGLYNLSKFLYVKSVLWPMVVTNISFSFSMLALSTARAIAPAILFISKAMIPTLRLMYLRF